MIKTELPLFLASKSPRRRKLLSILGIPFDTFSVDTEEKFDSESAPEDTAIRLANEKLQAAVNQVTDAIVITADTLVVLDDEIIGKPVNEEDAYKILLKLSGRTHTVYTAVAIANTKTGASNVFCEATDVTFDIMTPQEIKDYIKSGSPMDKAGAYGIQDDYGAVFIKRIDGCYYNVVGLPLNRLYHELQRMV